MYKRNLSILDHFIIAVDNGVRSIFSHPTASRNNPADGIKEPLLTPSEKKHSRALMRINHAGEISAQALYYGQAEAARSPNIKAILLQSGEEESDHLAWCQERLTELQGHTSFFNPLWYISSYLLGLIMGAINDKWSLGFVVETERQVEEHLKKQLMQLPLGDHKSERIIQQMREDESHHATNAIAAGAIELPLAIKQLMKVLSKIMIKITYYI